MVHPRLATVGAKLAFCLVVSIAIALMRPLPLAAHELRPAIADVTVGQEQVVLRIRLALEALVAEIDATQSDDTDEAPNAALYDRLRAMEPAALEAELRTAWPRLRNGVRAQAGEAVVALDLGAVTIPEIGDPELVRDSEIELRGKLPGDRTPVRVGWTAAYGAIVIRLDGAGNDAYAALLTEGELSDPLPRSSASREGFGARAWRLLFGD